MEHLFNAWMQVSEAVRRARRVLLCCDYDGTLTPIVERPEFAFIPEETRLLLQALSRQPRFIVGIISGRALADLKGKVGVPGIVYAGNHGLEIEAPGLRLINPIAQELRPVLRVIHEVLTRTLSSIRGVFVEDKGLTLSVHYRQVDERRSEEVKNLFHRVLAGPQALGKVKVTTGKKVYEVRPAAAWDKGKAIALLMRRYGKGGRKSGLLPIYLGDDLTDEDGFRVLLDYGWGIPVFVGSPGISSSARYYLISPAEVVKFMGMLLQSQRTRY